MDGKCGINLKSANFVAGLLNGIFSFAMGVVMSDVAAKMPAALSRGSNFKLGGINWDPVHDVPTTELHARTTALAVLFFIKCVADLAYVYGVIKEKRSIIVAYASFWMIMMISSAIVFCYNIYYFSTATNYTELAYIIFNIVAIVLCSRYNKQLVSKGAVPYGNFSLTANEGK